MRVNAALGFVLMVPILGCGKSSSPTPPPKPPPAASSTMPSVSAASPEAPPPAPAAPGAPAATAPAAAAAVAASSDDAGGQSGLAILNTALMQYGMDGKKRPVFKDLPDLVNQGLISQIPTPPEGKKFVFDPKTGKAMLANK